MGRTEYEELMSPKKRGIGADTVILCFLSVILILLFILVTNFSLCRVDGASMNNTLVHNQHVLLNKSQDLQSGDIVVFHKNNMNYIKRVIAVGGEAIRFVYSAGHMVTEKEINGEWTEISESYIAAPMDVKPGQYALLQRIEIPQAHYFVMGDNRNNSDDSRTTTVGMVAESAVMGKAVYILSPSSFDEWLFKLIFSAGIKGTDESN